MRALWKRMHCILCKFECLNKYIVSIAVVSHLWRSLCHIVSYSRGWMSYEGKCIVHCASPNKSMYLPKKVCRFSRPFQLIVQLCSQTELALSETCASIRPFATKANDKNEGGQHILLPNSLIYLRSWTCIIIITNHTPTTYVSVSYVTLGTISQWCFL